MLYQFNISDLLPYCLMWLILYISLLIDNKKALLIGSLSLIVFSGLRYGIGYDYPAYVELISGDHSHVEWLSRTLMDFAFKIKIPQAYFMINSLISIIPIVFVSKRLSISPCLSLFIYALIPLFFIDSMSIVRNASAYSILFLGAYYLMNSKYLKAFVFAGLAIGLHSSAYIFMVLYFVVYFNRLFTYKVNVAIFITSVVFMFFNLSEFIIEGLSIIGFLPDSVIGKLEVYSEGLMEQGRFVKFIWFLIGFINLIIVRKVSQPKTLCFVCFSLYNIGLLLWSVFSFDHTLSLRFSTFFFLYIILLAPYYLLIKPSLILSMRTLILIFFTIFCSLSFYVNIVGYNNSNRNYNKISFLPYQTIFSYTKYSNY